MKISKFTQILLSAVLLTGTMIQAQAQDKKVDPTGTYLWTQAGRNGGPDRTNTLVLKLEGDKLTGKLSVPGRRGGAAADVSITDGKLAGAAVSFSVVREFNGNSMTNKYSGTLTEGGIKGKIETERNGQAQTRDWEAKVQK
jgi:hypothetical protein